MLKTGIRKIYLARQYKKNRLHTEGNYNKAHKRIRVVKNAEENEKNTAKA